MIRDDFKVHSLAAGKRAGNRSKSRPQKVTTVVVHPDVWDAAMRLCEGDYRRIVVFSEVNVLVKNKRS